ncbi:hypothetical protein M8J76_011018 [Diaphorina citri]|nr:hypothetical protein M8J75_003549 [Diaphorina citri]KAI5730190.1 hypothetical protein M8J76_011018 [Diaphorina citri]
MSTHRVNKGRPLGCDKKKYQTMFCQRETFYSIVKCPAKIGDYASAMLNTPFEISRDLVNYATEKQTYRAGDKFGNF